MQDIEPWKQGFYENNFAVIDKERHKELSRLGGIKSGETRRRKAAQKRIIKNNFNTVFWALDLEEEYEKDFIAWKRHRDYLKKKREKEGRK